MAISLYTQSFGSSKANLSVIIRNSTTQLPAVVYNSGGAVLNTLGTATLDGSGNLSVYIDTALTWSIGVIADVKAESDEAVPLSAAQKAAGAVSLYGATADGTLVAPDGTTVFGAAVKGLVSGAGVRTLSSPYLTPYTIYCEMSDGRLVGTSPDTAGQYGAQIWIGSGTPESLTRTAITASFAQNLLDYNGATIAAAASIGAAWETPDGAILFMVNAVDGRSRMYRAAYVSGSWVVGNNSPAFNNLRPVVTPGLVGSIHVGSVRNLAARSVVTVNLSGSNVMLFGEYNYAEGRIAGQTSDICRVWRSNDNGVTWSALLTWNQNGTSSQMRHVHSIVQDPDHGYVYIMIGDVPWSSLIRWDGVSAAPPANTEIAQFGQYPGWAVLPANEVYRSVDLLFDQGVAAYLIDNTLVDAYQVAMHITRRGRLRGVGGQRIETIPGRDPVLGLVVPGGGAFWVGMWNTTVGATRGYDVWHTPDMRRYVRIGWIPDPGVLGTFGVPANLLWVGNRLCVSQGPGGARIHPGGGGSMLFEVGAPHDGVYRNLAV